MAAASARALASALVVAALACGGGSKSATGPTVPDAPPPPPPKPAFFYLPANSDMLVGVDVAAVRDSALGGTLVPLAQQQIGGELAAVQELCGIDVINQLNRISVGGVQRDEDGLVIEVTSTVSRAQLGECMKKVAASEGGADALEIVDDGAVFGIRAGDDSMWSLWLDESTFLTSPGAENQPTWPATIEAREGVSDPLFKELVARVDPAAAFYMALVLPPEARSDMSAMGATPVGMFVTMWLQGGATFEAGMRMENAQGAEQLANQLQQFLPMLQADPTLGRFLTNLEIAASGTDVVVKLALTEAEFQELVGILASQLPGLMMMIGA